MHNIWFLFLQSTDAMGTVELIDGIRSAFLLSANERVESLFFVCSTSRVVKMPAAVLYWI
jgi:hypothetical protein